MIQFISGYASELLAQPRFFKAFFSSTALYKVMEGRRELCMIYLAQTARQLYINNPAAQDKLKLLVATFKEHKFLYDFTFEEEEMIGKALSNPETSGAAMLGVRSQVACSILQLMQSVDYFYGSAAPLSKFWAIFTQRLAEFTIATYKQQDDLSEKSIDIMFAINHKATVEQKITA